MVVTGVTAGLTLTSYNLTSAVASEGRLVAVNLAREGIEVIRNLRDTNWLAGNPWDNGITVPGFYRLTVNFDESANQWTAQTQAAGIDSCAACQIYFDAAAGIYSHNLAPEVTPYKRLITLREICWQEVLGEPAVLAAGQNCSDFGQELVGWEVISEVTWHEASRPHNLKVIDRLYDWR